MLLQEWLTHKISDRLQFVGHPEAAADDEFGEWILDGHDDLPRSYLPVHPKKVQPGMNTDERGWKNG
jgi:hypothetical protein